MIFIEFKFINQLLNYFIKPSKGHCMALLRNKQIDHWNRLGGLEIDPAIWDMDGISVG